jgi:hypothetical protein
MVITVVSVHNHTGSVHHVGYNKVKVVTACVCNQSKISMSNHSSQATMCQHVNQAQTGMNKCMAITSV